MNIKPIKPEEVVEKKRSQIPDEVIESFNEMIAEEWDGSSSTICQDDVLDRIHKKLNKVSGFETISKNEIFDKHYLDVEDIFRDVGWTVKYDKPGYNETYQATFEFSRKIKRTEY